MQQEVCNYSNRQACESANMIVPLISKVLDTFETGSLMSTPLHPPYLGNLFLLQFAPMIVAATCLPSFCMSSEDMTNVDMSQYLAAESVSVPTA
jgi:hypothetical protein